MRASHWSEDSEGEVKFVELRCKLIRNLILGPLLTFLGVRFGKKNQGGIHPSA
jgi:hypothetical protein